MMSIMLIGLLWKYNIQRNDLESGMRCEMKNLSYSAMSGVLIKLHNQVMSRI